MESQDFVDLSCTKKSSSYTMPSQNQNQFNPLNIPFQPVYHFNTTNGTYPIYLDQHNGSRFSFQKLLNTPVDSTKSCDTVIAPNKRFKDIQNSNSSPPAIFKKVWTKEEDIALTESWLYISMHADVGNNQKNPAMWNRILDIWKEKMGPEHITTRNNNSLQCHWFKIQAAVNKFMGRYELLERRPQSGTSSEDLLKNALRSYEDVYGVEFKYIHCWEILINNPKWCSKELTKIGVPKKQNLDNSYSPMINELVTPTSEDPIASEGITSDGVVRPQGRKSCKERKRKLNEEKSVVDALNKLQYTLEKQINVNVATLEMRKENEHKEYELREQVMKKEIELKEKAQKSKEEAQIMKMKDQRRQAIMNQDLSKLSPSVRASYEILQAQILKEWESDGLFWTPCFVLI